jgi:hypothetical protein
MQKSGERVGVIAMEDLLKILDRPIAFQRSFVRLGIGVTGAVFLSQMVYWMNRAENGWFYKTQDEWTEETGLSRYEQEGVRKQLRHLGILNEKKQGLPAKLFYSIDEDKLYQALICANKDAENSHTGMGKTGKQVRGKLANIHTEITTENTTDINTPLPPLGEINEYIQANAKKALDYYNKATGLRCRDSSPFAELLSPRKSRPAYTLQDITTVIRWVVNVWKPRNGKPAKPANICRINRFDGYCADAYAWAADYIEIDCEAVIAAYNEILGDRLPVADCDSDRVRAVKLLAPRLAVKSLAGFQGYFEAFSEAPEFYFGGPTGAAWRANFDYLMRHEVLKKTREGAL